MNLNDHEKKILSTMRDHANGEFGIETAWNFRFLATHANMERTKVRLACRSLARKQLTRYERALMTDDGEMAGAGYGLTKEGLKVAEELAKEDGK